MTDDGLFHLTALLGAIVNGQSNAGTRKDGKICTAQAGECRYNSRYYSLGMRDAKSWSMPCADDTCSEQCCYLRKDPQEPLPEETRHELVSGIITGLAERDETRRLSSALFLGMLGIDPGERQ